MSGPGVRVNVGCGPHPTPGWINVDNSPSVLLGRVPARVVGLLKRIGLVGPEQLEVLEAARRWGIRWGRATRLPFDAASVDAVYSSHMLEHLDRGEARQFLAEAHRVLRPGGWIRIVVPDLALLVEDYLGSGDADAFLERQMLARPRPRGVGEALRQRVVGFRGHRWMYDAGSLARLLSESGFGPVHVVAAGETHVPRLDGLDLRERESESVYLEAQRPLGPAGPARGR